MVRENGLDSVSPGAPLPQSMTLPGGAGCSAQALQVTAAPGQTVLTVGTGEEYKTIGAAVAAAVNGDLILIQPGTYTNDFADVMAQVTIAGAGGLVNLVANEALPNEKGIFVVDSSVTIENLVFQGAEIPDSEGGNGAGIRYEGGAMVLNNDAFLGNQNGILCAGVDGLPVNTVTIENSTFDNNGNTTGPNAGYTHNAYISTGITSLVATGNIFERANVGHELKSRAQSNLISGNIFYDGPSGTASYSIDLPNGGTDTVSGNLIEKGPDAENNAIIHFGGEGIPYAGSSLSITGNHFINDLGNNAQGLLNQTTLQASITGNEFDNFANATLASGPYTQSGNVDQNGNAIAPTNSNQFAPGTNLDDFSHDSNPHNVVLTSSTGVLGGGGLLTVTADAGHVTVIGGSGGLIYQEAPGFGGSYIASAAGAWDTITAPGQDTVAAEGNDNVIGGSGNLSVQVDGHATITGGSGSNGYIVNGQANILGGGGADTVQVNNPAASAFVTGNEGYLQLTVSGGTAGFAVQQGGGAEQATITGGASGSEIYNATMNITTAGAGAGSVIAFGAGTATVMSEGADTINAGSGSDTVIVSGSSQINAGSGTLAVFGRGESGQASIFGASGTVLISGDTGDISYFGGQAGNTVNAGLSNILLQGGAGRMSVNGSSNQSVVGGAGGIVFSSQGGNDLITTQAGAHDTVSVAGASSIVSNGSDLITQSTGNGSIVANGNATITGSTGAAFYTLNGADSLTAYGYTRATVGAGSNDTVSALGSLSSIMVSAGGTLSFSQQANADHEAVTITGGGASLWSSSGADQTSVTLGGAGDGVVLGGGHEIVSVTAQGAHLWTGSGNDVVNLYQGGAVLHAGSGAVAIGLSDGSDQLVTTVYGGGGALTMGQGYGNLDFIGGHGSDVIGGTAGSETVTGGSGNMTLQGGSGGTDFIAGSARAAVSLTAAGGVVTFGTSTTSVTEAGWGSADIYDINRAHGGGSDTITGFRVGTDSMVFNGVTVSGNVSQNGSTQLTMSDGTHILLVGVASLHF
jgi:hypothetical protein